MDEIFKNITYSLAAETLVAILAYLIKDNEQLRIRILIVGTLMAGLIGFSSKILEVGNFFIPEPQITPTALVDSNSQANQLASTTCEIDQINRQLPFYVSTLTDSTRRLYTSDLRQTPGYENKDDTDVLYKLPCLETVELLGDTKYVDGLTWWNVRWRGYTGWLSDHFSNGEIALVFYK